jgi:hypothetical protein
LAIASDLIISSAIWHSSLPPQNESCSFPRTKVGGAPLEIT